MKTILYLGTDPSQLESQSRPQGHLIHYPVIQIVPRSHEDPELKVAYDDLPFYTHLLFTSKNAVNIFCEHLRLLHKKPDDLQAKTIIAIGSVTAAYLSREQLTPQWIAEEETQEGVIALLNSIELKDAYFFFPRSSLSRPILANFFKERQIRFQGSDLYDTIAYRPDMELDLDQVDEIIFTSPSTVTAFIEIFGALPRGKKLLAIGPITEKVLLSQLYAVPTERSK